MAKEINTTLALSITLEADGYWLHGQGPGIDVGPCPFYLPLTEAHQHTLASLPSPNWKFPIHPEYVAPEELAALGRALYQALFIPEMAAAYERLIRQAGDGEGVRLRLTIQPPEIANLPWELLHNGNVFIATLSDQPIVRSVGELTTVPMRAVRGPLRILYAWAAPPDATSLPDLAPAATELQTTLNKNRHIHCDVLEHADRAKLKSKLEQVDYHVFCFAGHGENNHIYLEAANGYEKLPADKLASLLEGKGTRLVYLAACETADRWGGAGQVAGFAHSLSQTAGVPAVVAMQYRINPAAANQVMACFFESLANFRPVDAALSEARKPIDDEGTVARDVFAPVLYLQSPAAALFRRSRNTAALLLGAVAVLVFLLLAAQQLFFRPDRRQIQIAESTAAAESAARATAQTEVTRQRQETTAAQREEQIALARFLVSRGDEAWRESEEYQLALLLGLESLRRDDAYDAGVRGQVWSLLQESMGSGGFSVELPGHSKYVTALAFVPHSSTLLSAGWDGTIRLWGVADPAKPVIVLQPRDNTLLSVSAVAISPNGERLAAAYGRILYLWSLADLRAPPRRIIVGESPQLRVHSLSFSDDGRYLAATVLFESFFFSWDLHAGDAARVHLAHTGEVTDVAFIPGTTDFVSASQDGTVRMWAADNPAEAAIVLTQRSDDLGFRELDITPRHLAVIDSEGDVQLWDKHLPDDPPRMITDLSAHDISFTADGSLSWSSDGDIYRLNLADGALETTPTRNVGARPFAWSADGRYLAIANGAYMNDDGIEANPVRVIYRQPPAAPISLPAAGEVVQILFDPASGDVIVADDSGLIQRWQTSDGRTYTPTVINKLAESIGGVVFHPVTGRLAAALNGGIHVWNLNSSAGPVVIPDVTGQDLAFQTDGAALLVIQQSTLGPPYYEPVSRATRIDLTTTPPTKVLVREILIPTTTMVQAAPSLDGRRLAVASAAMLEIWNLEDLGAPPQMPQVPNLVDTRIFFDAAGETLGVADLPHNAILLWALDDPPRQIMTLPEVSQPAAFSHDGRLIAARAAGGGGFWSRDDPNGAPVILTGLSGGELAFTPDDQWLTVARGNHVELWPAQLSVLVDLACRHVRRNLTMAEWNLYLEGDPYQATCPGVAQQETVIVFDLISTLLPPTITPVITATPPTDRPFFNGYLCENQALFSPRTPFDESIPVAAIWQQSAPRGALAGDVVRVALRSKWGEVTFPVTAQVIAPDGTVYVATRDLVNAEPADLLYPDDFPGAVETQPGLYTVLWEAGGRLIQCHGFAVAPRP